MKESPSVAKSRQKIFTSDDNVVEHKAASPNDVFLSGHDAKNTNKESLNRPNEFFITEVEDPILSRYCIFIFLLCKLLSYNKTLQHYECIVFCLMDRKRWNRQNVCFSITIYAVNEIVRYCTFYFYKELSSAVYLLDVLIV